MLSFDNGYRTLGLSWRLENGHVKVAGSIRLPGNRGLAIANIGASNHILKEVDLTNVFFD